MPFKELYLIQKNKRYIFSCIFQIDAAFKHQRLAELVSVRLIRAIIMPSTDLFSLFIRKHYPFGKPSNI